MSDIKPGDRIQQTRTMNGVRVGGGERYIVRYAGPMWVIYEVFTAEDTSLGERAISRQAFKEAWEKVQPFFERGGNYRRHARWSIFAQQSDVTEEFSVDVVRTDGSGTKVAFGCLSFKDANGRAISDHRWVTMSHHAFDHEGWSKV
jgi:hypothetical protein